MARAKKDKEPVVDTAPQVESAADMYNHDYFIKADGNLSWNSGNLKFGDALAALSYAHGITWETLVKAWPNVFNFERYGKAEVKGKKLVYHQLTYLRRYAKRYPKRVLEIGGGRGEVANTLKFMDVDVVSVEPGSGAVEWYQKTAKQYYGPALTPAIPLNKTITQAVLDNDIDWSTFDTILMVESLEHIPKEQFDIVWEQIVKNFHGWFIVTNWIDYHPMWIGRHASPEEHCRLVDDHLYDEWTAQSKGCLYRNGSHLVLEF